MKIDLKKVEALGGKIIEFDETKKHMIIFDKRFISLEDAGTVAKQLDWNVLLVEGEPDKVVALYEIKEPTE